METKDYLNELRDYIDNHADFIIINRAAIYVPTLIKQNYTHFEFQVHGSAKKPYKIQVDIQNNGEELKTTSSCTCPYDGPGICKHQVATIREIMKLVKAKKITINSEEVPLKKTNSSIIEIPIKEGVIQLSQLEKMSFNSRSFYYFPTKMVSVSDTIVKGLFEDYSKDYSLIFKYDRVNDRLTLSCDCKERGNCSHKLSFLKQFLKRFPVNFFSPTFIEDTKKSFMEEKKYAGALDFDDLFQLNISTDGVNTSEKVDNLLFADEGPLKLYSLDKRDFFVPKTSKSPESFGVGLCLDFRENKMVEISPFIGKLNKSKTELTSKFKKVDEEQINDALFELKKTLEKEFLLEAIQLNNLFYLFSDCSIDSKILPLWEKMNELKELLLKIPIYTSDVRNSFIRKNTTQITINTAVIEPLVQVKETEKFYQLDLKIRINEKNYALNSNLINATPIGIIFKNELYLYSSPEQAFYLSSASGKGQMNSLKTDLPIFLENILKPLSTIFKIDFPALENNKVLQDNIAIERHVYLDDEGGEYIVLRAMMKYGEQLIDLDSNEKIWLDDFSYAERDTELEESFVDFMQQLHPNFTLKTAFFYLFSEEALKSLWLIDAIEKMTHEGIKVFGLNNLSSIKYNLHKPTFSTNVSSGTDWFDLELNIDFGGQKVDLKSLQKSILSQQNYVELKDGTLGLLPKEWIEKYKKYFKLGQIKKDKIEISNYQFNLIDELYEELTNTPKFLEELQEKKKRLANLSELQDVATPKGLKAKLRPYQKDGLNWMVFLHENKLGGCLADDMGLGKTLQTIAFILYLKKVTPKKDKKPHLIVAPTSLMFNWQAEIEKFAPTLKCVSYIGPNREELRASLDNQDIVLTTYGSLINDIHFHKNKEYYYVVLDESQAIKNPQSQRFKAVRLLQCFNRLVLTGTPIENNTFDLYSQFSFINPGIFGSIKHFKSTFSDAIDKDQDQYTSQLLARMIHPFILRRTKDQVATELPPKTESVIYCEMGSDQRKVYDTFKQYFREKLLEQIEDEGVNKSQMYILQGLTKLRQICNSTALADKDKDYGNFSTKLDELARHLKEKVGKHKVLVFSQFVGMLQLVKTRLVEEGISFEYLDGQTSNREEKVTNFQTDKNIRVFLISLKAGGTGLNLTEADYVYLIDPWWNPAVESQAIDRCYRIGQAKKVMAYRMICKDSIEEQIVQLQHKKRTIASDVIQVDVEKKTFSKEDVELFFS